ncbi:MAG: succinylglutamate desuccinylase/aspartoacylase family protein, partial [Gammaproteobacteria bacterium]|nr:succinylglutamate desuccinylase/aspartoacylase family protein [Gammaproteobacteria bacterium]
MAPRHKNKTLDIGGESIAPGQRARLAIPLSTHYTNTPLEVPLRVINGRQPGPTLFISAAVHGDELNGIEIIRRLMATPALKRMKGALIAAPMLNVLGVMHKSRYLPDRRDLNRSFPGSAEGSMASRLANLFTENVLAHAQYGIDLHTAAIHRDNFPQIRADLDDEETTDLARAFGAPVMLNAGTPEGSLRGAAVANGVKVMVYEAGEALRYDETAIRVGVNGILGVMRKLGMLPPSRSKKKRPEPMIARSSSWVRANGSGMLRPLAALGTAVKRGQLIGRIAGPFHEEEIDIKAPFGGIIIGRTNIPLIHEGEAMFHIARFEKPGELDERLENLKSTFADDDPL